MKRFAFLLAVLLPFASHGWVASRTSGGSAKHWELLAPSTLVDPNVVNRTTHAVRYFLASDGYSVGNVTAELNALRASFAQWQAISGTHLKFEEGGLVAPGVDVNTSDNQNVLFWAKNSTIVRGGTASISGALGVTFTSFYADGLLAEADIVFNGVEFDWHTDFNNAASTAQFVEGTALHEIGHFIGLAHSPMGSASMFWVGSDGVDAQAGLSLDEISAARSVYPIAAQVATRAALKGQVTKNGSAVLGAAVILEGNDGNAVAGAVTRPDGTYLTPSIAPGNYQVRVTPLDSSSAFYTLVQGADIASEYGGADTTFLPTGNTAVALTAGVTNTQNIAVTSGNPAFRIAFIRAVTANSSSYSYAPLPTSIRVGQSNYTVGVASDTLPTSGATLSITGDGLTLGTTTFVTLGGFNFMSVRISVASNATPGLRSFVVQQGPNTAYANGFLDLVPASPDYNFDGLDDVFQRRYFPLFTAPEAGPNADPDNDKFVNSSEYVAATVPTDSTSLLRIERIRQDASGATVTFRSVAGKRYQLYSKLQLPGSTWQTVGTPVTGLAGTTSAADPSATSGMRFYKVQVLP
jgi:hypothetical protein